MVRHQLEAQAHEMRAGQVHIGSDEHHYCLDSSQDATAVVRHDFGKGQAPCLPLSRSPSQSTFRADDDPPLRFENITRAKLAKREGKTGRKGTDSWSKTRRIPDNDEQAHIKRERKPHECHNRKQKKAAVRSLTSSPTSVPAVAQFPGPKHEAQGAQAFLTRLPAEDGVPSLTFSSPPELPELGGFGDVMFKVPPPSDSETFAPVWYFQPENGMESVSGERASCDRDLQARSEEDEQQSGSGTECVSDTIPRSERDDNDDQAFACPFYKRDAIQHMDCLKFKLKRIQDVKQHIQRRHGQTSLSCPICKEVFSLRSRFNEHIRTQRCRPGESMHMENLERVSDATLKQLRQRVDRKSTPASQWYAIWDMIFENHTKPISPYAGSMVHETAEIWRKESVRMIPNLLENKNIPLDRRGYLELLLVDLYDAVQTSFEKKARELRSADNFNVGQQQSAASDNGLHSQAASIVSSPSAREIDFPEEFTWVPSSIGVPSAPYGSESFWMPFLAEDFSSTNISMEDGHNRWSTTSPRASTLSGFD